MGTYTTNITVLSDLCRQADRNGEANPKEIF